MGPGFFWFFFFYLSELLCVDTKLGSKCFQRNVFCWLLCQLLDNMCPSLFPKWPLYLPPLKALIHPLLSLVGQNSLSMGCLTAGMLSVQFPPPRQNCDLLEVLFSVVWPLTSEPVPRSSGTASLGLPRCFARVVWSHTSIWDVGEFLLSNFSKQFSQICASYCIQACLLSWCVLRRFLFLFET